MNTLALAPLQWSALQDIDAVEPINESDTDCLSEIRDVLRKYGKMNRLGIALLHSHFDMSSDEILLETTNSADRTLITQPVKESEAGSGNVGTIWMLREGDAATMSWCKSYCRRQFFGHGGAHRVVK